MEGEREKEKARRVEAASGVKRIEGSCEERSSLFRQYEQEKRRTCAVRKANSHESKREREREKTETGQRRIETQSARPRDGFSHRPILGAHGFGAAVSLLRR